MTIHDKQAICDILRYIQKYPNAKHTAEGIAKNWIFQQRLEENLGIVLKAIHFLVEAGFLIEIQKEDNQCYFSSNPIRINEIPGVIKLLEDTKNN